jgi:hypothetical protein
MINKKLSTWLTIIGCCWGIQLSVVRPATANTGGTLPPGISNLLNQVDQAANRRNLSQLMGYYSNNFSSSDGFTKTTWEKSLNQFWQSYSQTKYQTIVESWQPEGNGFVVNTVTQISGTQKINDREMRLESKIQSRQRIVNNQIIQQEIVGEKTQVKSGNNPPTVDLIVPFNLKTDQSYNLDAIVREPIGEDALMGAILTQRVAPDTFNKVGDYEFELLNTGGFFKTGIAPGKSGDYWLSTIFVRPTGMTTVTQRIRVSRK